MKSIPVYGSKKEIREYTIVSDEDYEFLSQWHWRLHVKGYAIRDELHRGNGYRLVLMHREVLERALGRELVKGEYVDHVNHQRLDNQRQNLRAVSASQNNLNLRATGVSQYLGVYRSHRPTGKQWRVQIRHDGRLLRLGTFASETAAALFYDAYAIMHKLGTPLNFPETWGLKFGDD